MIFSCEFLIRKHGRSSKIPEIIGALMIRYSSPHNTRIFGIVLLLLIVILFAGKVYFVRSAADTQPIETTSGVVRYLPIGDSYTIGETTFEQSSFPSQLAKKLTADGIRTEVIANPARTGFTTRQVIDIELPVLERSRPDMSTLLIGVNDWVQGISEDEFRSNLSAILDRMKADIPSGNIVVITIPDFSITPTGKLYAVNRDAKAGISRFNQIVSEEALKRRIPVVDIYPLSQTLGVTGGYVALDGLHPTGKAYARWIELIYPVVRTQLLKNSSPSK